MKGYDSDKILIALETGDLQMRLAGVERAADDPSRYVEPVVALIERFPSDSYFILERIGRFGTAAVPYLQALARSTANEEVKLACTLGLAHFQAPIDLEILTDAIHNQSTYQHLACRALAWLKATPAIPMLLKELSGTDPSDGWRVVSLVNSIRELGGALPGDEVTRLNCADAPLEVTALFEAH
jgi:hypothetical protein